MDVHSEGKKDLRVKPLDLIQLCTVPTGWINQ